MVLGGLLMPADGVAQRACIYPLALGARVDHRLDHRHVLREDDEGGKIMNALYKGVIVSGVVSRDRVLVHHAVADGDAQHGRSATHCSAARWSASC